MNNIDFLLPDEPFHFLPYPEIERPFRMNDMGTDALGFQPVNHRAIGKGQHDRLKTAPIERLYQAKQITLPSPYFALANPLQYPYFFACFHGDD
jgi:hypothetical protein